MSDQATSNTQVDTDTKLAPPGGDTKKAEKYLSQLIDLINKDRLTVSHTDLKKFDPSALEDHYQLELADYHVEVSHSKHPSTGKDFYNIIFNNLRQIRDGCTEKTILAYMHLSEDQFQRFAGAGNDQIARKAREAEEKRFNEALQPIDEAINKLNRKENPETLVGEDESTQEQAESEEELESEASDEALSPVSEEPLITEENRVNPFTKTEGPLESSPQMETASASEIPQPPQPPIPPSGSSTILDSPIKPGSTT